MMYRVQIMTSELGTTSEIRTKTISPQLLEWWGSKWCSCAAKGVLSESGSWPEPGGTPSAKPCVHAITMASDQGKVVATSSYYYAAVAFLCQMMNQWYYTRMKGRSWRRLIVLSYRHSYARFNLLSSCCCSIILSSFPHHSFLRHYW